MLDPAHQLTDDLRDSYAQLKDWSQQFRYELGTFESKYVKAYVLAWCLNDVVGFFDLER